MGSSFSQSFALSTIQKEAWLTVRAVALWPEICYNAPLSAAETGSPWSTQHWSLRDLHPIAFVTRGPDD